MASTSSRALLVAEIGNTTTLFCVFRGGEPVDFLQLPTASLSSPDGAGEPVAAFLRSHPDVEDAVLSSVVPKAGHRLSELLRGTLGGRVLELQASLRLPFSLSYDPPSSIGADRLALMARCCMLGEGSAVIALDLGTAIPFDVLSSRRVHLGGLIMPGLELTASALSERTARLPKVEPVRPGALMGRSTEECILSGVVWGCVAQVEGLVRRIRGELEGVHGESDVLVVATGGNAGLVCSMMDEPVLLDHHAVERGAAYLFEINGSARS